MNPALNSIISTIPLGIFLLTSKRENAIIPILISACYQPLGQKIYLGGLDFSMIRILIIIGLIRVLKNGEISNLKINIIDKVFIYWAISTVVTYTLLYKNFGAFTNRSGLMYDALGLYFLSRIFINDFNEIEKTFKVLSIIIAPLALEMAYERIMGRNLFYIFGGIHENVWFREGTFRANGSFSHPILIGTFAASAVPFFISIWFKNKKLVASIGLISSSVIVWACGSSGAFLSLLLAIIGLSLWRFREQMRSIRWIVGLGMLFLHLYMKDPIWHLAARFSGLLGGTGWHRAHLIDQFIKYFNEWWLIGTTYTVHWMGQPHPANPNMSDITNWYIGQAVNGGLVTMLLFIVVIIVCFFYLGEKIKEIGEDQFNHKFILWVLGTSLFVHAISMLSVAYFDKIVVAWYLLLAMISTASFSSKESIKQN
jgi:hypothetical protein